MVGSRRPLAVIAAGLTLLLGLTAIPAGTAGERPALTGLVKDRLGNLLSGAQVLILPQRAGARPVAEVRTAADGRFDVPELRPGTYRVAAVKEGYLTFLGEIDTFVRSSFDMILDPLPSEAELLRPEDSSWVLRVPRRSVLREVDGTDDLLAGATAGGSQVMQMTAQRPLIQGELAQMISKVGSRASEAGAGLGGHGTDTRVRFGSPISERGYVGLQAHHGRLTQDATPVGGPSARRTETSLSLDIGYDASLVSRVDVNAYYQTGRSDARAPAAFEADPTRQAQRTWGYDARWSRQLDEKSRVQVEMDYARTSMDAAGYYPLAGDGVAAGGLQQAVNEGPSQSLLEASGSYEITGHDHRTRIVVSAARIEMTHPGLRPTVATYMRGLSIDPGWNMLLDAEHAWSMTAPLTMVYGVEYQQNLHHPESALVTPRAGVVWTTRLARIDALLSYATAGHDLGGLPGASGSPARGATSLGYRVGIEVPLPYGMTVRGGRVFQPVFYGWLDDARANDQLWWSRPSYLSDGRASIRRDTVGVEREFGPTRVFVELGRGHAAGNIAALTPLDEPLTLLEQRELKFTTGKFGLRLGRSGTEILGEYQRVEQALTELLLAEGDHTQDYYEFRLTQPLGWLESLGTAWRFVLVARAVSDPEERQVAANWPQTQVHPLDRQISAGVAVAF